MGLMMSIIVLLVQRGCSQRWRLPSSCSCVDNCWEYTRTTSPTTCWLQGFLGWSMGYLDCRSYICWRFISYFSNVGFQQGAELSRYSFTWTALIFLILLLLSSCKFVVWRFLYVLESLFGNLHPMIIDCLVVGIWLLSSVSLIVNKLFTLSIVSWRYSKCQSSVFFCLFMLLPFSSTNEFPFASFSFSNKKKKPLSWTNLLCIWHNQQFASFSIRPCSGFLSLGVITEIKS